MGDSRQVYYGVDAFEKRSPVKLPTHVLDEHLTQLGRGAGGSSQAPHRRAYVVPAREQLSAKCGTDKPRCTRNKNAHIQPVEGRR
jgi:hypothetical protein